MSGLYGIGDQLVPPIPDGWISTGVSQNVSKMQPKSAVAGPDGYAIDHTGFIYLVGKDGRYIDFLPPGLAPERIVEALRLHPDRQNGP